MLLAGDNGYSNFLMKGLASCPGLECSFDERSTYLEGPEFICRHVDLGSHSKNNYVNDYFINL